MKPSVVPAPDKRKRNLLLLFGALLVSLLAANLFWGSVSIPARAVADALLGRETAETGWGVIVCQNRLPQAITALFAGAALAVSGVMLQTVFNNPLAGPSILGIDAGASLGVAIVMLLGGSGRLFFVSTGWSASLAAVGGAFLGAALILGIILLFSLFIRSHTMLLIIGILVGYITSSAISLLNFFSSSERVFSYTLWGMGSFSGVAPAQLPLFCGLIVAGLGTALLLVKPLNALLLGNAYAANLGVNIRRVRLLLLVCTGLLTAVSTAFCGPIAFIGLTVPHIARLMLRSSNHNGLLPLSLLTGSAVALLCNLLSTLPGNGGVIPLNAITPILGAPVILYVIVNQRKIAYFN